VTAETITCPTCGYVSSNRYDIRYRYCGRCHQFHDNPALNDWTKAWMSTVNNFMITQAIMDLAFIAILTVLTLSH
jgi:hypothetical protein